MKKALLEIYALLVCLFSLDKQTWEAHQSDAAYSRYLLDQHRYTRDESTYPPPHGAELTSERQSSYAEAIRAESREALQGLVRNVIILLISIVAFAVHWKIAANARHGDR